MILTLQHLLQKAKTAADPRDAHALALDLVESMLRHYAVVAIAAYRHAGARDAKVNRILSEQLPRPSMGSWKNFLQMLSAVDKGLFPESFWDMFLAPLTKKISNPDVSSAYARLRRLADQDVFAPHEATSQAEYVPCTSLEFFDAAVAYRNRFAGHGTHELSETPLQNAPLFLKGAAALCNHLNTLWFTCPVYVTKQAKLYGRTFFRLTPLVEAEGIGELQVTAPSMEEDRLYICFGDKKHPEVESLYPAALWEEDDILFANGTKGLIDIHYIGYASQRSFETSIYEEDFRVFLCSFMTNHELELAKPLMTSELIPQPSVEVLPSIAVLPFIDMSPEKDQDYFCEGMAEEIINALTHIESLHVVARTSAFSFKGKDIDVREIGSKLDVAHVLEGSIRKSGNRLRITAQLIKVENGFHIWSERFDRTLEDVFVIQDEISLAIVKELKIKLLPSEKERIIKRYTDNIAVYELYLQGLYYQRKMTGEGYTKANEYFKKAIEIDPNFAPAYIGLALNPLLKAFHSRKLEPPQESYMLLRSYTQKALEIDINYAEAHGSLSNLYAYYEWDWVSAEREMQTALKLNPNSASIHMFYSHILIFLRRYEEAIKEARKALELEPISGYIRASATQSLIFAGNIDDSIQILCSLLVNYPDYHFAHYCLGMAYRFKLLLNESINEYQKAIDLAGDYPWYDAILAINYHRAGNTAQAEYLFNNLEQRSFHEYIPPSAFCYYYAVKGELDIAFQWLDKACEIRDNFLVWCIHLYKPYFGTDPRYLAILKKIGLPTE